MMPNKYIYDFEKPLSDIQNKINELRTTSIKTGVDITLKINDLVGNIEAETTGWYKSFDDVVKGV